MSQSDGLLVLSEALRKLICPAGNPVRQEARRSQRWRTRTYTDLHRGYTGRGYSGYAEDCANCSLRSKCIRGKKTKVRNITLVDHSDSAIPKMIERFNTERGRHCYSRRMGTVEPVFANITATLGLNRLSLRGRLKVGTQWKLFCTVHNIGKLAVHCEEVMHGLTATEQTAKSHRRVVAQEVGP